MWQAGTFSRRKISFERTSAGRALVNGSPLKFYHFTKFGGVGLSMTERYGGDNVEVYELWQWYHRKLTSLVVPQVSIGYWAYGQFSNGVKITDEMRRLYRSRADLMKYFDDPYEITGNSLYEWFKRECPKLLDDQLAITG